MAAKTLTIEIGNEFIKISDMQKSKKNVMVYHAVSVQTPDGAVEDGFVKDINAVADTIRKAMMEQQIVSKEVTFVINSSRVSAKEVVIPVIKKEEINSYLDMNITDYFPINIDDYVISFTVLETENTKTEKKSRILVFAAPAPMVDSYYSLAKVLGMKVTAVDSAVNSTLQLIKIQIDAKPTMVVQMGIDTTIVSVMNENTLQLQRTLPYGISLLLNPLMDEKNQTAKGAMDLLTKAALVKESLDKDEFTGSLKYLISNVNRVIEYYTGKNSGAPIQKIVIIGEGADVLGMDKLFTNETNLPTESLTLLKNVESYNRIALSTSLLKQYMANVGACLDPIHLQPKTMSNVSARAAKSSASRAIAVYAVAGVLAAAAVFLFAAPKMKISSLESDRDSLQDDIDSLAYINNVISDCETAKSKAFDMKALYYSTFCESEWADKFMDIVEKNMPSTMRFSSLSISNSDVTFTGTCTGKDQVAKFMDTLENDAAGQITNVSVTTVNEATLGIVSFSGTLSFVGDDTKKNLEDIAGMMAQGATEETTEAAEEE